MALTSVYLQRPTPHTSSATLVTKLNWLCAEADAVSPAYGSLTIRGRDMFSSCLIPASSTRASVGSSLAHDRTR